MNGKPSEPHRREREIFLEALDRTDPDERAAYLDAACARKPDLRKAVEELLLHQEEDSFMASPVIPRLSSNSALEEHQDTSTQTNICERPGDQIGHYRLLQMIGEGGAGVVFMAEQQTPVRRRVALKVLKPGMDTKTVVARFESERQALALMDHPNIAKVLDAGSTANGRPFFVMELVRGIRITEYCDQNRLPARERLELFIKVCHAIQHAHQKGIIHRDLKPSNILVTLHDGVPVPKVIDFGIAKAIDQRLTDKTFFTEFHAFIGTPAYVSPEQAEMSGLDIDTRTDIYSLGVLLYEILIGKTPFDGQKLLSSGLDGMRRTIREEEPTPPSTRFRLLPEAEQTTTAQRRQAEPARLAGLLRGELDWIILKALEKDRTRRYPTANDMAMDVQRYLNNEPIIAHPPSPTYRFQKLIRRNRLLFAAGGAFALALLIGLVVSTWQFLEKNEAYHRAVTAEGEQGRLRRNAEEARIRAERLAIAARGRAYAADMNLVQQALMVNNLGRAQDLLNRQLPDGSFGIGEGGMPASTTLNPQLSSDLRGWEWRYLWQQCRSDALFTLCQLPNEISAVSVSHDGRWVALGEYRDRGTSIWDLRARREITRFPAGESSEYLAFSPAASILAFFSAPPQKKDTVSGISSGRIQLWDVEARRLVRDISVDPTCQGLAFSKDGTRLFSASGNSEYTIFSVEEGSITGSVSLPGSFPDEGKSPVTPIAVNGDLSIVAHPLGGGRIRVVNLETGQEIWTATAAEESVTALAISTDGSLLASGSGFVESTVRLWDVATGRELARMEGHRTYVRALQFWPDGETLASASGDQTIHLWNLRGLKILPQLSSPQAPVSGRTKDAWPRRPGGPRMNELHPYATLRGHRQEVWSLALCPDQTTLVSGSKDGTVCVWDTSTLVRKQTYATLPVPVRTWCFLDGGQSIVSLDDQGGVTAWHGSDYQQSQSLFEVGSKPGIAHFSLDGRYLAISAPEGSISIWDVSQGTLLREIAAEKDRELPLTFLRNSSRIFTRNIHTSRYRERDVITGQEIRHWQLPTSASSWLQEVSSDGDWVFSLYNEGSAKLHHLPSNQQYQLAFNLEQISGAAFSPNGRWLAVVSILGFGQLWDTETAQMMAELGGFLQGTHSVTFSPDSQRLAIGSNGNEAVKIWDVENQQELVTLPGQGSMFRATKFSPDGNILTSCNSQGILHIWRAPSFEEINASAPPED